MNEFAQLVVGGIAVGALYGLVALGFVVVYRATLVINFALGSLLLLGTYLTYAFRNQAGLPFFLAVPLAMAGSALVGVLIERTVLRRMVGQPVLTVIMVTIGIAISIDQVVTWGWGPQRLALGDPWGLDTVQIGGVGIASTDIARLVTTAAALGALWLLFRRSAVGLAMRASASDQEAAAAQGISVNRVVALSWAVSAATATLAGVLLASGPQRASHGTEHSMIPCTGVGRSRQGARPRSDPLRRRKECAASRQSVMAAWLCRLEPQVPSRLASVREIWIRNMKKG